MTSKKYELTAPHYAVTIREASDLSPAKDHQTH